MDRMGGRLSNRGEPGACGSISGGCRGLRRTVQLQQSWVVIPVPKPSIPGMSSPNLQRQSGQG